MEMCDRKYMYFIWFKLEWSKHAQKRSTRKNIFLYIQEGSINHSFNVKKFIFTFSLKICKLFKGMKHTPFTICTLFDFKKLKCFLNITEYTKFLIKSFLITYLLFVTYIQFDKVASYMQIQRFKYVWEPFPHQILEWF